MRSKCKNVREEITLVLLLAFNCTVSVLPSNKIKEDPSDEGDFSPGAGPLWGWGTGGAQPRLPPALTALPHSTQEQGIKFGAVPRGDPLTTLGSQHNQTPGPQIFCFLSGWHPGQ